MVAKVISGKNIRGLLNYNEHKVAEGVAQCITANRFGCEPEYLTFLNKLNRFHKVTALNKKVKTNAVHISLNFDIGERLSNDKLGEIATAYMSRIGFGEQPYLVYRHMDAAHPHVHIVTTNIKSTGERIDLHNIGRTLSETARKEIEVEYGLIKAEGRRRSNELINGSILKPVYGTVDTKRSITNVVGMVVMKYKFTSLPELNSILRQFNVIADRGAEGTLMHRRNGLQYSLLDRNGKKVGVPIKASSIYGQPTLKNLEKQFALNAVLRNKSRNALKALVDQALLRSTSKEAFIELLLKQDVHVVFRENDRERVYGITFVDNKTKVVFNGSDLGKKYGAQGILDRIEMNQTEESKIVSRFPGVQTDSTREASLSIDRIVDDLITARQLDFQSAALKPRRKKRKKKGRSL